eukprot:CAMPEP_0184542046 /NCGR_PEP_ID=MMETSP0199_2-20130426/1762_1 /TAXON_ID=1112570 /ORGANISM="Thraustochytrium sp., Strain LLF1b" /LENGTH=135 /DNA_ID=CAMNT_0026935809 /DNA_START=114 /DNA_END=521 /DNA_ORIENTATION=+
MLAKRVECCVDNSGHSSGTDDFAHCIFNAENFANTTYYTTSLKPFKRLATTHDDLGTVEFANYVMVKALVLTALEHYPTFLRSIVRLLHSFTHGVCLSISEASGTIPVTASYKGTKTVHSATFSGLSHAIYGKNS